MVTEAFKIHPLQTAFLVFFPIGVVCLNILVSPQTVAEVDSLSQHSILICFFHYLTGFLCPGCGMTRSLIGFFTGHLEISYHFNPFGPLFGMSLVVLWVRSVMAKEISTAFGSLKRVAPLLTILLLSWGIYRNF